MQNNFSVLAFTEVSSEIDKVSLNITPIVVENDIDTLKTKSNRFRCKNYNTFRDVDDDYEEDDSVHSQIKRGELYDFGVACKIIYN